MKTTNFLLTCALFTATAFVGLQPISAKVLYVGTGAQWSGKPTSDVHATPNAAFTAAAEGDEIWIAGGVYGIGARLELTSKLVSFYGGFAGTENAIGERAKTPNGKGWEFANPTILKQAATISNAMFYAYSPASAPANATISINGLTLDGSGYENSGISWRTGTTLPTLDVSIKNCIIQDFGTTGAVSGGGISIVGAEAYASFVVDSCLIENNTGSNGGGVNVEGEKTIRNSAIRNNTATGTGAAGGGGIYIYAGTAATG
ncbi:MAG: hypothetical protein LBT94_07500, partial [Prevotellaceae bacterium]|nr:hypothetical protein [Prevotellaceae bacterium]